MLRGSLPEHVAAGLEPFAQRQGLPLVGPEGGESELDAAVRAGVRVDRVPTPEPPSSQCPRRHRRGRNRSTSRSR